MKIKLICAALAIAMLLGMCGCAAVAAPEAGEPAPEQSPNFISADKTLLSGEDAAGEVVNLAAVDEEERPLYQIVYNAKASLRVKEQCEALAAAISETTGVELPVRNSLQAKAQDLEIVVGECKRDVEMADKVDSFKLDDSDFVICFAGSRLLIYAETDYALVSGMIYMIELVAKKDPLKGLFGIEAGYEFCYHPDENPAVEISKDGDYYVNITLVNGPAMKTYARLSYTGNKGWRLQTKYRESESFKDDGAAQILAYSMGEYKLGSEDNRFYREKITVTQVGDEWIASHEEGGEVRINSKSFKMEFYSKNGNKSASVINLTHNAGGSSITGEFEDKGDVEEAVYGTGERMNGANQRGQKIEMFTKDIWSQSDACYMVIPLISFSRGSGIFFNNYEHMVLDLGSARHGDAHKQWTNHITGAPLDCYIYTTEQIEEVIGNYSKLTGFANMPEEWTYGMIVCAYSPDLSQKWTTDINPNYGTIIGGDGRGEGVYEMIANMEANDLPWTGVLAEPWGIYTQSKQQDLKELCDYVHSLGKKFLVYMAVGGVGSNMPGFHPNYYLTQTRPNGDISPNLPSTSADTNNPDVGTSGGAGRSYIDVTNPDAVEWFFDTYWDYLSNEIGADGCKIDFCEQLPENYTLNYFDSNIPTAGSHHWYPTAFCAKFFDMLERKPDGGMCYTRGGGIGSQRAPYMWSGDQMRNLSGIRYQLSALLTSGLSGVPFMSYDMSGYQYGSSALTYDLDYEAEMFLLGTKFSAYSICLQTHGKVLRAYQFMGLERPMANESGDAAKPKIDPETGKQAVDEYGNKLWEMEVYVPEGEYEYVTQIYRAYTKLHEHLTPYITELSEEACTTGVPVVRHLVLGWQDDPNVYSIDDEFMMGDAFLVAPVFQLAGSISADEYTSGNTKLQSREVYLPALEGGAKWIDLETGKEYAGGQTITVTDISVADLPTFFNTGTSSEIAATLVDGITEIYAYASSFAPKAELTK